MNQLPEFWRTEVWHPLSVHFPLAILLLASMFYLAGFFSKKIFLENMSKLLIVIGTIGAWIAIYTGNLAHPIVSRQICDPTGLKSHETNADIVGWIFPGASALIILDYFDFIKKIKRTVKPIILILVIAESGFLSYTGHLGAGLVYQQAAGVYTPSEGCNEFTD
jgi:uncharacterized membrane protein